MSIVSTSRVVSLAVALLGTICVGTAVAQFDDPIDPNDPWPAYMQNQRNTGQSPYHAPFKNPEKRWSFDLGTFGNATSGAQGSSPIIVYGDADGDESDERVVITGLGNTVYAFNAQNYSGEAPELIWKYQYTETNANQDNLVGRFTAANLYTDDQGTTQKTILFTTKDQLFAIPLTPHGDLDSNDFRTDSPNESGGKLHWSLTPTNYGHFAGGVSVINLTDADNSGTKSLVLTATSEQGPALEQNHPSFLAIDATGESTGVAPGSVKWRASLQPSLDDETGFTGGESTARTVPAIGLASTPNTRNVYVTNFVTSSITPRYNRILWMS